MTPPALFDRWTRPDRWPLVGAAGSAALLLGALGFEVLGDYPPCPLCIEQRWAHVYALIAGAALFAAFRFAPPLPAIATRAGAGAMAGLFAFSAWRAVRHAGMEYGFWVIPCQGEDVSDVTIDSVLGALNTAQNVVLCDEAAWTLFGVSMAGYNALFSAAFCAMSLYALFRNPTRSA